MVTNFNACQPQTLTNKIYCDLLGFFRHHRRHLLLLGSILLLRFNISIGNLFLCLAQLSNIFCHIAYERIHVFSSSYIILLHRKAFGAQKWKWCCTFSFSFVCNVIIALICKWWYGLNRIENKLSFDTKSRHTWIYCQRWGGKPNILHDWNEWLAYSGK